MKKRMRQRKQMLKSDAGRKAPEAQSGGEPDEDPIVEKLIAATMPLKTVLQHIFSRFSQNGVPCCFSSCAASMNDYTVYNKSIGQQNEPTEHFPLAFRMLFREA
ncbi:MAG: hypothetical protein HY360_21775 [Verrucomicrobia bacterium]|nr:hypothetical protein [Verrucomicrobiota bacterium]